jgi:hypothetical protein
MSIQLMFLIKVAKGDLTFIDIRHDSADIVENEDEDEFATD